MTSEADFMPHVEDETGVITRRKRGQPHGDCGYYNIRLVVVVTK